MKKIILFAALASAVTGAAQEADTLFNCKGAGELMITDGSDGLKLKVTDKADEGKVLFEYHQDYGDSMKVSSHRSEYKAFGLPSGTLTRNEDASWKLGYDILGSGFFNYNLGFVAGLSTPSGVSINPWRSSELSWLEVAWLGLAHEGGKDAFRLGVGLTYRNFCLDDDTWFVQDGDAVSVEPSAGGESFESSRLMTFSVSVSLLWAHRLGRHHVMKLGPIVNFNTYSNIGTLYKENGRYIDEYVKGQERVPVTVDLYGTVSLYRSLSLYVRYSPCNVLKTGTGPQIKPLSFGLAFGF